MQEDSFKDPGIRSGLKRSSATYSPRGANLLIGLGLGLLLIPVTLCACGVYFVWDLIRNLLSGNSPPFENGYHWHYWSSRFSREEPVDERNLGHVLIPGSSNGAVKTVYAKSEAR
jgi:hypothetical protein